MSVSYDGPQKVVLHERALNSLLYSTNGLVGRHMRGIGREILNGAQRLVPKDSGALRASLRMKHVRLSNSQKVTVGSSLRYAYLIHEGARPHEILPHRGGVLRFENRGRIVHTRHVHHPGYRGKKYLTIPLARAVRR